MDITYNLKDIKPTAAQIWQQMQHHKVWAFHAEMGAGKTTFIHALCEGLGVKEAIGSPTYTIINEYKSSQVGSIYHLDLYRLRDEEEAMQAGVEDVLNSGNLCLVEWPEKAAGIIPANAFNIYLQMLDEQTRRIKW